MTARFADTSFFVALLSVRDRHHRLASRYFRQSNAQLVTTAWILIELGNFFSAAAKRQRFVAFVEDLQSDPALSILPPTEEDYSAGFDLYARRPDKEWSFVDCISFIVMQRRGFGEALTTDHHFEQAGFQILLK